MFTQPIKSLDDWFREYQRDVMLKRCMYQPLNGELDQFVKTDKLGQFLRDKAIAELSGTLPENDDNLRVWSNTIFEEFDLLALWLRNYTLGFGIGRNLDIEKAIEEVKEIIIEKGVSEKSAKNFLNIEDSFWREKREYYESERKKERAKAEAEKHEFVRKMLKDGLTIDVVAKYLGLSIEEVEKLK